MNLLNEEIVFQQARQIADRREREEYVRQQCNNDPRAHRRVDALLAVWDDQPDFLQTNVLSAFETQDSLTLGSSNVEDVGTSIGSYQLVERIGEGGFGIVFRAEQTNPVRREVALKLIKPGMDTGDVVARFENERQLLALMDHPNICRVLDGGQTHSGRPFFVMDLVKGTPLASSPTKNN
jgi:serine/threonine protein kinase